MRLGLTIARTSQCPVNRSSAYFTSPEDRNLLLAIPTVSRRMKTLPQRSGTYLIFTLATVRQRAAGVRALLLQKISLEPLFSDRDSSRRDTNLQKLNYLQYEKRQPTLQDAVGSTENYLSSSDQILSNKDAPSPSRCSSSRLQ